MAYRNIFGELVEGDAPNEWGNTQIGQAANTGMGSTRPEVYQGGAATAAPVATGGYETPDWLRNSALMLDQSQETQNAFFNANPQYLQDWQNIRAGGRSQFATDGSTLIKSNFDQMSPEAAAYYRSNPDALLANEGFGHDPTLAYMNYYGGPASIGANNKTQNISGYLRDNKWTPNGIVGGVNNFNMYANTPFGAGTAGYLNGRPGQATPQNPTGGVMPQSVGGGVGAGGSMGAVTGGVMPQYAGGGSSSYSSGNPYLQQQANALTSTMTDNWRRNVQPQIASGAQLAGGFGGSRQGVIEANSANDLDQGIGSALANLFGSGYNTDRNYDLGMGNLGLGYANLDRNINNDNLGWQMQGAQFGLTLQDRLNQQNQQGLAVGTQLNDAAYQNWLRYSQGANSLGNGYGTTTGTQTTPGNVLGGALGGAQLGGQIGNWWGSGVNNNPLTNGLGTTGMAD